MLTLKRKNITLTLLTVLGLAYFCTMSHIAVNPFWKSEMLLIPIQLVTLIYVTYLRSSRR
ncbi:hypothetical protein SAMD00079811_16470 [Scytonema sp. HK-05]|jgi:hypothetical protein|nr:hypothetical protein NIES2130_17285 [Scytonema sp. HK-05]BAY44053.1 hypothetical protein SAMD00079811_16470 [Scytonema sp. HK-05]